MDTSDSECFESADEELYSEDEEQKKCAETKHVLKVTEDLINLNVTDSNIEENKDESNKNLVTTLRVNDNLKNQNIPGLVEINDSRKGDNEINVKGTIQKSAEIIEDVVELKPDNLTEEVNIEKEDSSLSEESQSELSQIKQTNTLVNNYVVSHSNKCIKTDVVIAKNSEDDENMWDNNDWGPIVDKKESVCNVKNNIKPNESASNDNAWDNDWEAIQDTKDNKESTNIDTDNTDNENMWDNDDWEPFEKIENVKSYPKEENKPENSWSGWGNWGVSSILTTATQGVSTLTNQMSHGLSTVLESGIGIPDPKELARQDKIVEKLDDPPECDSNKQNVGFGFSNLSNLVSGVSHFVETTGSKVITGGLDTLETIGKKTMEVLQEGDPGLKNKRALLKIDSDKPILSQVLREAKERSEKENKALLEVHAKKKLNYEILFDDYHGLVHLEALEMLSKQCDIKLQTLRDNSSGNELQDLLETMDQVKELCELPDEEDDEVSTFHDIKEKIQTAVKDINVNITYEKLILTWQETENWLNNLKLDFCDESEIHQEALQVLAQLTAIAVEQFHRCGELLLVKEHRSTADEADSLVQLTMAVTSLIGMVAAKFSEKLNSKSFETRNKDSINELITNVFFEAGNSSSYVQDAFQLLVPVLQVGAV